MSPKESKNDSVTHMVCLNEATIYFGVAMCHFSSECFKSFHTLANICIGLLT